MLRAGGGDSVAGSLVTAKRDESGDEEDKPLKLKITKPRKKPAKKDEPEKVGVAASPAPSETSDSAPDKPSEPPADAGGGGAAESSAE